jgi:hypothetical protein
VPLQLRLAARMLVPAVTPGLTGRAWLAPSSATLLIKRA